MSPRSRIVGPGRAPSMTATTDDGRLARPRLEPERAQRLDDDRLGPRQLEADLGMAVQPPSDVDDVGQDRLGGGEDRVDRGGFAGHDGSSWDRVDAP